VNYSLSGIHSTNPLPPPKRFADLKNNYNQTKEAMLHGGDKPTFEGLLNDVASFKEWLQTERTSLHSKGNLFEV
jgi:hypothetical protein